MRYRLTSYAVPGENTSPRFAWAFAEGVHAVEPECDVMVSTDDRLEAGSVAMFGSPARWDILNRAREAGRTWFYGDHGYFGRGRFYRITKNAFQATTLRPWTERGGARVRQLGVNIQPWRKGGRHVLVCPPDASYAHLMERSGVPIERPDDWGVWAREQLSIYTDRPVRVRERSAAGGMVSLAEDLQGCHALVTFMSNAAVEAAVLGVPVFVLGPAAGRAIGLSDLAHIERPDYPDTRPEFVCTLASQQWTLDEIRAGDAWRYLRA